MRRHRLPSARTMLGPYQSTLNTLGIVPPENNTDDLNWEPAEPEYNEYNETRADYTGFNHSTSQYSPKVVKSNMT
jgi:hypothetical protein